MKQGKKMADFNVVKAGVLSLIQDAGRIEQAKYGITSGGVADKQAYYWLNRLLQHDSDLPCVEVTFGGLELSVNVSQIICVTGADLPLFINGQQKRTWCNHKVKAGDTIKIGMARSGVRSYLGVHQGFKVANVFGSASTVVREKLGGIEGRALIAGDSLDVNLVSEDLSRTLLFALGTEDIPRYSSSVVLRVIPGYQYKQFTAEALCSFYNEPFTVSKQWDRMGYRLAGCRIAIPERDIISEGITYGAIQVPPDGQPIILLNDRQTLGGYPKIGSVLSIDTYKLAQCSQGATIHFEAISPELAIKLVRQFKERNENIALKHIAAV